MSGPRMYDDDHRDLATLCRQIFARHQPAILANLADRSSATHVAGLWDDIVHSGLVGLAISSDAGGGDGRWSDLAVVLREAGRALVPTTLASTVFAATVIDRLGSPTQRRQLLEQLLGSGGLATVAATPLWSEESTGALETTVTRGTDGWVLDGSDGFVANAGESSLLVVAARDEDDDLAVVVVPRDAEGVRLRPRVTFGGDSQFEVRFDGVAVPYSHRLDGRGATLGGLASCLDAMRVLQAGEMLGGADHVLEETTRYVGMRVQFGVAIGSFQAVQHLLADAATDLAAGEAAWWHAAGALASDAADRAGPAAVNAWLGRAFVDLTVTAHQVHGGIGFARENPLHLWSQRARQLELTCGGAGDQLDAVADALYAVEPEPDTKTAGG